MDLKTFIASTIQEITDGLSEGHKHIKTNNGGSGVENRYKKVTFDIAVTTSDEDSSGVGGKVTVASLFSAGAELESTTNKTQYSRVQFETLIHVKTD